MDELERRLRAKIPGDDTGIEVRKSICAICDPTTQCGLDLYVRDGRIVKVEGSEENPHNEGTLCSKGAATRQYVYNEDRLRTPLKRVAAARLRRVRAHLLGRGARHRRRQPQRLRRRAGPSRRSSTSATPSSRARSCSGWPCSSGRRTSARSPAPASPLRRWPSNLSTVSWPGRTWRNARCLMVWSANPVLLQHRHGARLVRRSRPRREADRVDPRRTPLASRADIHLQLRPGTDGALALGMAHVIIEEGLYDREFVAAYTHGFAEYRSYVAEFDPATRRAQITGVPAEKIAAAARLYAPPDRPPSCPAPLPWATTPTACRTTARSSR